MLKRLIEWICGRRDAGPTLLPFQRSAAFAKLALETSENDLCTARRENETLRSRIAKLECSQAVRRRVIERLSQEIRKHRHFETQMQTAIREYRDAIELYPWPFQSPAAAFAACPKLTAAFMVKDLEEEPAVVWIAAGGRAALKRIVDRILPPLGAEALYHVAAEAAEETTDH